MLVPPEILDWKFSICFSLQSLWSTWRYEPQAWNTEYAWVHQHISAPEPVRQSCQASYNVLLQLHHRVGCNGGAHGCLSNLPKRNSYSVLMCLYTHAQSASATSVLGNSLGVCTIPQPPLRDRCYGCSMAAQAPKHWTSVPLSLGRSLGCACSLATSPAGTGATP